MTFEYAYTDTGQCSFCKKRAVVLGFAISEDELRSVCENCAEDVFAAALFHDALDRIGIMAMPAGDLGWKINWRQVVAKGMNIIAKELESPLEIFENDDEDNEKPEDIE